MIVQKQYLPLSFSRKDNINSSIFIDQFLKEAIQILKHADTSLLNQEEEEEEEEEEEQELSTNKEEAVTWQLNLTPSSMTLNTSINTVSGLEKVLELIRINVKPQPPKVKDNSRRRTNADRFGISLFHHLLEPVLQLSTILISPRHQVVQFNATPLMRHYIQTFIDCGHAFFLDIPSLIANTDMIVSQPSAAKEHTVENLLITSICSLMAPHTTLHNRGDMNMASLFVHTFYSQARQLLQDLFDVHHIAVVQSLFILSAFPQGHHHLFSPARTKNPLLTMAIRMALAMDLHRLDTVHYNESHQKEKLRRLAWMIFCADYYADFNTTGQTGMIDVADWHVDFPQPLPNEPSSHRIEFFSQYCRIILIRKLDLFKSAYMIALQSPRALASGLDHELFQTYFNTPDMFKIDLHRLQPTWTPADMESLLLYELYSHTQLFAQLPFLPTRYIEIFITEEAAFQHADLNDIYQGLRQTNNNSEFRQQQLVLRKMCVRSDTFTTTPLEQHCLVSFLATLNQYTLILEALTAIDGIGCGHNPIYGIILTVHLYVMMEKASTDTLVRSVCHLNLIRTHRMLRLARSIYADPVIFFLDRILARHHIVPNQENITLQLHTKTREMLHSLQTKTTFMK